MPDLTAPLLSSATPARSTTAVLTDANIVLTFSEAVAAGSGLITISDGASQTYMGKDGVLRTRLVGATDTRTVSISDASQVTIADNTVTINLALDLQPGKTYSVQMGKGVLVDLAGNAYAGLTDTTKLYFKTASTAVPTAVVDSTVTMTDTGSSINDYITNSTAQTLSGKYTGALASGDFIEVSLDNGATWITATTTGDSSGGTWNASGAIAASSTVIARVSNAAGGHSTAARQAYTFDNSAPTVTGITLSDDNLVAGETATVTFTFNEAVTGLDAADVSVTGGTLSNFVSSAAGKTWTATLTPTANSASNAGQIVLNTGGVSDLAGNSGPATSSTKAFTYNTVPNTPTATIASASMTDSGASSTDFITNTTAQTISGTLSAALASGEKVQVSLDNGATWTDAVTSGTSWSLSGQTISASNTLKVRVSNGATHGAEYSHSYTLDQAAPTATIALDDATLSTGDTATVTITFDEAVSGLSTGDFTVTGGTLSNLASTDDIIWTATLTPDTAGSGSIALNASGVTDVAGNSGPASSQSAGFTYTPDQTGPTVSITLSDSALVTGESATVTFTFSEAVTGLTTADLKYTGTLTTPVSSDGGITWTATLTPTTNGSGEIQLYANSVADAAGNTGPASLTTVNYTYNAAPTATVDSVAFSVDTGDSSSDFVTNDATQTLTGTLSAALGSGEKVQVSLDNGSTWSDATTSGTGWTLSGQSLTASGTLQARVTNGTTHSTALSQAYTLDQSAPTVSSMTLDDSTLAGSETATLTVVFSDKVSGLASGDFSVSGATLGALSSSDGITWTATLTPTASGTLALSASSVADVAGNSGPATVPSTLSFSYSGGSSTPSGTVTAANFYPSTTGASYYYLNAASQTVAVSASNLGSGEYVELSMDNGGTWHTLTTQDNNGYWIYSATLSASSTLAARVSNGSATSAAYSHAYVYDTTAPTTTMTLGDSTLKAGQSTTLTVTFSEAIASYTTPSFNVYFGTLTGLATTDRITWTATLTPDANYAGSGGIYLTGGSALDMASNEATASPLTFNVDTIAPTATLTLSSTTLESGDTPTVTVTFSEPVSDLSASDFTVTSGTLGTPASADGGTTWTATLTPSGSGSVTLNASSVADTFGNSGPAASLSTSFTYTASGPSVTISTVALSSDTGTSSSDFITQAASQTISGTYSGTLGSGEFIQVSLDGGATWNTATVSGSTYTYSGATLSASGTLKVRASNGSSTGTTLSQSYTVDGTAPAAPGIVLADDSLTLGETTTVTVTFAEKIASLSASDFSTSGATLGTFTTSDSGLTWTATLTPNSNTSGSGNVILQASAVEDLAGNAGPANNTGIGFGYDTRVPTLRADTLAFSDDYGDSSSDFITNTGTQTFSGNYYNFLYSGSKVEVSTNGSTWTEATTDNELHKWSASLSLSGSGTVYVRLTDAAGTVSTLSQSYTIDTSIGSLATHTVDLSSASDTGKSATDNITNDKTPTVTVNIAGASGLVAGDVLQIIDTSDSNAVLGTHTLTSANLTTDGGDISITLDELADGTYTLALRTADSAGNQGTHSTTTTSITIDTVAPTLASHSPSGSGVAISTGTVSLTFSEAMDTGASTSFEITNDNDPDDTRSFVGEATSGNLLGYDSGTHTVTLTLEDDLDYDGSYSVTYESGTLTDVAGNGFDLGTTFFTFSSEEFSDVIVAPDAVTLTINETAYASYSGVDEDGITSDNAVYVTGITASNLMYRFSANDSWTTVSVSGSAYEIPLPDGDYAAGDIQVKQYDAVGYESEVALSSRDWTVDSDGPSAYIHTATLPNYYGLGTTVGISLISGDLSGELDLSDDFVEYTTDSGGSWQKAYATTAYTWSVTGAMISSGGELGLRFTDRAGNIGTNGTTSPYSIYIGDGYGGEHNASGDKLLYTQMGNDTVEVSGSGNEVHGGSGNDVFNVSPTATGNDIYGDDGGDTININGDTNEVDSGNDDDFITMTGDNNDVVTGSGADTIDIDGTGNDVSSGADNDAITIDGASNLVTAGSGEDTITVNAGSNTLYGEEGADVITVSVTSGTLFGDDGSDQFTYSGSIASFTGLMNAGSNSSDIDHLVLGQSGQDITLSDMTTRFLSFEKISLGTSNSMTITGAAIQAMSDTDMIRFEGDSSDKLYADGTLWEAATWLSIVGYSKYQLKSDTSITFIVDNDIQIDWGS